MNTSLQYSNEWVKRSQQHYPSNIINRETQKWVASIISGFSGVWKDTLINEYIKKYLATVKAVSVTSRKPRDSEVHTKDYYFFTKQKVESLLQNWELVDSFTNAKWDIYGLPKNELKKLNEYQTVFFNVVPESWEKIQELEPINSLPVILVPRSFQEWKNRLMGRDDWMNKNEKMDRIQQDLDINFKNDLGDIEKSMKNGNYHYNGKKYFLVNEEWRLNESLECLRYLISTRMEKLLFTSIN